MLEERASLSPDALTGMEANHRFVGPETMETRIFGRLTAWQNWIFVRPNAVRRRRARCAATARAAGPTSTGSGSEHDRMSIDYSEKIPNNVDLAGDRKLQRALERWQPNFLNWWKTMGPAVPTEDVYLRTAVDVGREGWAHFDHVTMHDYRWGIFLAERNTDRRIAFGEHKGEPVWQEVPGEYRADLQRLIVIQGDTEPASVEQQRRLGATAPSPLRPAQPVPGQRRGGPPPLGDGLPAARLLRPRRPRGGRGAAAAQLRRRRLAAHPRRVQRGDARTGCRSSCSPTSPTGTASTSSAR